MKKKVKLFGGGFAGDDRFGGNIVFIPTAHHLVPVHGLARVAAVMRKGELAGRPDDGWRQVPLREQINHALYHLQAYLAGEEDEDHLANAGCRVLMALDLEQVGTGLPSEDGL